MSKKPKIVNKTILDIVVLDNGELACEIRHTKSSNDTTDLAATTFATLINEERFGEITLSLMRQTTALLKEVEEKLNATTH